MDGSAVGTSRDLVQRNIVLVGQLMKFLLERPGVFGALPDNFELVILPEDDPELRLHNLELLDKYGSEGKPVVLVRTETRAATGSQPIAPKLYVPIAA